jgi:hypothetical protein
MSWYPYGGEKHTAALSDRHLFPAANERSSNNLEMLLHGFIIKSGRALARLPPQGKCREGTQQGDRRPSLRGGSEIRLRGGFRILEKK